MGAMAVELETRLEMQIANARAAWAETAEIRASTSFADPTIFLHPCYMPPSLQTSLLTLRLWRGL